ncbi:helix-turn-helix domain-containing protein [Streptomyces sp. MS19]|uniref:helix-turn-helix domain-containing protein n=1 Tax=Streptomyces sp. MS19 TaxID=3385972 RepID=UPI0039A0549C
MAAEQPRLHHSTVARRLERIGERLGIDLAEPAGAAWRLLDGWFTRSSDTASATERLC